MKIGYVSDIHLGMGIDGDTMEVRRVEKEEGDGAGAGNETSAGDDNGTDAGDGFLPRMAEPKAVSD
jgi:hypothetical protein